MVIDASIAFKLILPEAGSNRVIELADRSTFIAPTLLHSEVANALWRRVLQGDIEPNAALATQLESLAKVVHTIDEVPFIPRALALAVELGHPAYDCVYLATAEAFDDEMLTADLRFLSLIRKTAYSERVKGLDE